MARIEPIPITSKKQFQESVLNRSDDKIIFVDIYRNWCGPCTVIDGTIKRSEEQIDNLNDSFLWYTCPYDSVANLDVEESSQPLFILYKSGVEIKRYRGIESDDFIRTIETNLG